MQKDELDRSEEEEEKQEKTLIRDQEVGGREGMLGGEREHLVGLLEGRGTCKGTLTPQSLHQRSPWRIREPNWEHVQIFKSSIENLKSGCVQN